MRKLFFALPLDGSAKEFLQPVYGNLTGYRSLLRAVSAENYHITLKFLGDIDEKRADMIIKSFDEYEIYLQAVPVVLKGLGAFPRIKDASVIWMGIEEDSDALSGLNERIEEFCGDFGFKKSEREFLPHLTVARVRKGKKPDSNIRDYIENNRDTEYGKTSFNRIVLYESVLKKDGPLYFEIISKDLLSE